MLITHRAPLRSALLSIKIQSSISRPSCTAASTILSQNQQRCLSFRIDCPSGVTRKRTITPATACRHPTHPITTRSAIPFHLRHASSSSSSSNPPPNVLEPVTTSQPSVPAESASTVPIIDATPDPTTSSAAPITPSSPASPSSPPQSSPESTNTKTTTSTTTTTTSTTTTPPLMTWNAFFHHRKIRRRYNLAFSLTFATATFMAGAQYLAAQPPQLETVSNYFGGGVDPIFVMGGATLAVGAAGWLVGPSVGGWVFGRIYRAQRGEFRDKEREFFKHVKKYRPNAGYSSAGNPLPDWYGEKIGSLREYRTWLKDQRAFNKRRESNFV